MEFLHSFEPVSVSETKRRSHYAPLEIFTGADIFRALLTNSLYLLKSLIIIDLVNVGSKKKNAADTARLNPGKHTVRKWDDRGNSMSRMQDEYSEEDKIVKI